MGTTQPHLVGTASCANGFILLTCAQHHAGQKAGQKQRKRKKAQSVMGVVGTPRRQVRIQSGRDSTILPPQTNGIFSLASPATPCGEHQPTDEVSTWVFTRWPPPSQLHRPAVLPGLKATWPVLPQPPGTGSRGAGPALRRPPGLLLLRSHAPPWPHHQAMLTSSGASQHRKLTTPQNVDHSTPHS